MASAFSNILGGIGSGFKSFFIDPFTTAFSANDAIKNTSQNTVDATEILKKLVDSFGSAYSSANVSAMDAEREEALLNRLFQQNSADTAMQFEADQAELSRQFYKDLSDTSYQRAVLDMKAAGLNPILAYTQGGASSSAVSGASGKAASGSQGSVAAGKNADTQIISAYAQVLNATAGIIKGIGEAIPF